MEIGKIDKSRLCLVTYRVKYICPNKPRCGHVIITRNLPSGVICPKCKSPMEMFEFE